MITHYALLKLLHLAAVVVFLGNVTLGLFWVAHAERTREPRLVAHAMQGIIRADLWFTWPGIALILVGGIGAAVIGGLPLLRVPWIALGIALFTLSGVVFAIWLAPLQKRIVAHARSARDYDAELVGMLRRWHVWGWVSLAPLWLALATMVLKVPVR
jgi:uncharacterized membrane protein